MTVLAAYDGQGNCLGRCDDRCHSAQTPPSSCQCICGGKNHGQGLTKALENTREQAQAWLEDFKEAHPDLAFHKMDPAVRQLSLFKL